VTSCGQCEVIAISNKDIPVSLQNKSKNKKHFEKILFAITSHHP